MSLVNSTPRIVFGGINDKSRGTPTRAEITYPQHAPLLRLFTQTGPSETTYIGPESASFNAIFGMDTLNRRSKYYNLQSMLAEVLMGEGNGFFIKRLIPEDAKKSRLIVGIEIVRDQIPAIQYRLSGFNYDGQILDEGGNPIPPIDGYRARIVLIPAEAAIGGAQVTPGTLVAESDGMQSNIYPLFELEASYFGKLGDYLGLRIWRPTYASNEVFDEEAADLFKTVMYRVQFMQKLTPTASPSIVMTAKGEDYTDVTFTEGTYSPSSDKEFYIGSNLVSNYADDGIESGMAPLTSPFGAIHVYSENIATVQNMIYQAELSANPAIAQYITAASQIDFLTGVGVDGDIYHSLYLLGPLDGGVTLGSSSTIYAIGGEDGTINQAKYEELVTVENLGFGQLGEFYEDKARYPFSHIYDTGLSMEGKFAMMNVLAARQDLKAVFTTYIESEQRKPTLSEELSRGQVLEARLQAYPESLLYGTGVCRAEIIYQTGDKMGGGYSKPVPQILDYAQKWARFAGAGTGILRDGADIDAHPNNQVTFIKNLNVPYFNARAQTSAWGSGGTYSLTYDVRSNYYPCIRSVYKDTTSVLLSPITVNIACDVMRMITRIHAKFSGNAKLSADQLIERADKEIIRMTNDRYAGRVTIVPETYLTENDITNGTDWHCKVRLYANNPRTTMYFELETYRSSALGA